VKRRHLIAVAAACGLTAGPRAIVAQSGTPIRIGAYPTDTYAEPFYAQDTGIFRRAGLSVELSAGPTIIQALVAGAVDVATGDVIQAANPVNAGVPIGIFAGGSLYTSDAPATLLCVAKNSVIRTAKELEGQNIGVIQLATLSTLGVREWMRQNGADVEKARLIEIPFSAMNAALQRGQVAAAMIAEPFLSDARNDVRPLSKAYDAIAKSFYISTFFATRDWLAKNADTARRVARALYDTAQWANTHRDESAAILAKYAKLEIERVRAMTRTSFATSLDERLAQPLLDVAYRYRQLTKPLNAADVFVKL